MRLRPTVPAAVVPAARMARAGHFPDRLIRRSRDRDKASIIDLMTEREEPPVGRREAQIRYPLTTCVVCSVWYFSDLTSLTSLLFCRSRRPRPRKAPDREWCRARWRAPVVGAASRRPTQKKQGRPSVGAIRRGCFFLPSAPAQDARCCHYSALERYQRPSSRTADPEPPPAYSICAVSPSISTESIMRNELSVGGSSEI